MVYCIPLPINDYQIHAKNYIIIIIIILKN